MRIPFIEIRIKYIGNEIITKYIAKELTDIPKKRGMSSEISKAINKNKKILLFLLLRNTATSEYIISHPKILIQKSIKDREVLQRII
jgi:hypothetical protein